MPRPWSTASHRYFNSSTQAAILAFMRINNRSYISGSGGGGGVGLPKLDADVLQRIFQLLTSGCYAPVQRMHRRCVMGPQQYSWGAVRATLHHSTLHDTLQHST